MEIIKYSEATHMEEGTESHFSTISSLKYASPRHYHDFYEFFLITHGSTIHVVNEYRQQLSEGSLVFMRPDDVHYYNYDSDNSPDCQFINICYTSRAVREVFGFLGEDFHPRRLLEPEAPPFVLLTPLEADSLVSRLDRLRPFLATGKAQARIQLRGLLTEMLTQYFSCFEANRDKKLPLWFEALLIQMNRKDNFADGLLRMYDLSRRSPGHLNRAFRQYLSTTPTAYINDLRLKYAKNLLLTTRLSITDIALESGFNNLSHFFHLFKKHFHITPSHFRRKG